MHKCLLEYARALGHGHPTEQMDDRLRTRKEYRNTTVIPTVGFI
jgi:hypothetical protein